MQLEVSKRALVKALSEIGVSEEDMAVISKEYINTEKDILSISKDCLTEAELINRERLLQAAIRIYFTLTT